MKCYLITLFNPQKIIHSLIQQVDQLLIHKLIFIRDIQHRYFGKFEIPEISGDSFFMSLLHYKNQISPLNIPFRKRCFVFLSFNGFKLSD
jgi:hypothetical protein